MVSREINWQDTEPGALADPERLRFNRRVQLDRLAQYPRVQANVLSTWGTSRGRETLTGLLVDDRDRFNSKVQGFPPEVYAALDNLLELHDLRFPQHKPKRDIWDIL